MEKRIIGRGILAGALAGVLAFAFARIFIEPIVGRAVAFEEHTAGHEHGESAELFSRGVQSNIGMGLGVFAFSVAMGALFAVVFYVAYGRVSAISARALSLLLAGGMLVALWIVPALKYPPSPPATSLDETIRQRALLYLLLVVVAAALLVAAVYARQVLLHRLGGWNATLAAAGGYLAVMLVVLLALPTINEVPDGFPATDLYDFRLYGLINQVIIWATIGLVFGTSVHRLLDTPKQERVAVS